MSVLKIITLIFLLPTTIFASNWYVRNDGGTTTQCTGHTDAAYPGSGTGQNCAYSNLQNAVDAVVAGDTVLLKVGDAFNGTITIPNKSCTVGSPCTIKSNTSALPNSRVSLADATNMAKVQALNNGNSFLFASNADYWTIDGIDLIDNSGAGLINDVIDIVNTDVDNTTITRCLFRNKETGTNYERSIVRGVHFEGNGLLFKWNYVFIIGYFQYPEISSSQFSQMDTSSLLCIACHNLTMEDNYINTWWNNFFFGGADTIPQNTATLTSATTTSATFSNTTGLTAGIVLRLEFLVTGTFNSSGITAACVGQGGVWPGQSGTDSTATITRTSGAVFTSSDIRKIGNAIATGDASEGLLGLCAVSGNTLTVAQVKSQLPTNGQTVNYTYYETAIVTSVVGSTVNYTPYGEGAVTSNGAITASWNYGDQGLPTDISIKQNTFDCDVDFAIDVYTHKGYSPKGLTELKIAKRLTFEGNRILGFPRLFAIYPSNQYGTAPWITVQDITFRNNWYSVITGHPDNTREAISIFSQNDYATITPLKNIYIYNNLFKGGIRSFSGTKQVDVIQIYHNTIINDASTTFSYNDAMHGSEQMTNFVFRDNIIGYVAYGMNCFLGLPISNCWSGSFSTNLVVNADASGDAVPNVWGAGSTLGNPLPTSWSSSQVGFTNAAGNNYRLLNTSLGYHAATEGGTTDVGINQDTLEAALSSSGSAIPKCNWHANPKCNF